MKTRNLLVAATAVSLSLGLTACTAEQPQDADENSSENAPGGFGDTEDDTDTETESQEATASAEADSDGEDADSEDPGDSDKKTSTGQNVDDGDWLDLGEAIDYRLSGQYRFVFDVSDENPGSGDKLCLTKTVEIQRYGVPTEADGFIAGTSDKGSTATIDRQATLAMPRFAAYPVDKDGNLGDELRKDSNYAMDITVKRDPDRSSSPVCLRKIPKQAESIIVVPDFEGRKATFKPNGDNADKDGWHFTSEDMKDRKKHLSETLEGR